MAEDIQSLAQKYEVFYEVSPYYLVIEERHGSSSAATRRVQTGFDVNIIGVNTSGQLAPPGSDRDYALGCCEIRKIAEDISDQAGGLCAIEAISFPSTAVLDFRDNARVEAVIRIRISHLGDLDKPADVAEQRALEEVEKRLHALGIRRR